MKPIDPFSFPATTSRKKYEQLLFIIWTRLYLAKMFHTIQVPFFRSEQGVHVHKKELCESKKCDLKKVSGIVNLLHGRCKCEIKSKAKSCLWKHEIAFTVFPLIWAAFLCLNKYGGRHTLSLFLCQMRSKCQLFFYPPCALRVFGLSLVPSTRFIERERYKVFLCCRRKIKNGFIEIWDNCSSSSYKAWSLLKRIDD